MSTTPTTDTEKNGGLPEDDGSLNGFSLSQAAAAAFAPPARRRRPPGAQRPATAAPTEDGGGDHGLAAATLTADDAAASTAVLAAVAPTHHDLPVPALPNLAPAMHTRANSQEPLPALTMVDTDVRRRFEHYQTAQKLATGHEPTNAVVVRRAFLHAQRQDLFAELREAVRHQQHPLSEEDMDPDGLFGDVPTRRVERGRTKSRTQLSFRPSGRELAVYDAYSDHYAFPNRSDFLNALLDGFLPQLLAAPKRTVAR